MTIKQRKAIKEMVANGGNTRRAMLKVGYSPATAHTPQKLTESKGFTELADQYRNGLLARGIDGNRLAKKVDQWLEAEKPFSSLTEPDRMVPDYSTQLKAGEMLREDFGLSKQNINVLQQFNAGGDLGIEFIKSNAESSTP